MGWVNPRVELGRVGLGWVGLRFFDFWWVGLCRGSETAETQKLKALYAFGDFHTDGTTSVKHGASRDLYVTAEFLVRKVSIFRK